MELIMAMLALVFLLVFWLIMFCAGAFINYVVGKWLYEKLFKKEIMYVHRGNTVKWNSGDEKARKGIK